MNEDRIQAALTLIQALLDSPNETADILNQNLELLDADFLNVMAAVVQQLETGGNGDAAEFLKTRMIPLVAVLGLVEGEKKVQREMESEGEMSEAEKTEALRVLQCVWSEIAGGYNIPSIHGILQENLAVVNNWQIYPQLFAQLITATLAQAEVDTCKMLAAFLGEFGNIIQQFPLGNRLGNLEIGIAAYENALQVFTREAFPQDWATTQNNLANAYSDRIRGEKADNLEQAIAGYENALQVFTREAFPQDWATTQNNLANAYSDRIRGEKADNLEQAIAGYENALQVRTREAFPQEFADTSFNLGLAYQEATQWQNAHTTFANAINTVESMREEILSGDESKQKLAEQYHTLYISIVKTCLQLNQTTAALEYAERSKTRNLVEQILLRDSHTIFPQNVATELAQLRDEITSAQYQIQQGKVENYPELEQRLQQLRQRRNQLQDKYLPVGSSFRFDSFQHTLDSHTAIIEWYITRETFLAFIITPPSSDTKRVEILPPPRLAGEGDGGRGNTLAIHPRRLHEANRLDKHLLANLQTTKGHLAQPTRRQTPKPRPNPPPRRTPPTPPPNLQPPHPHPPSGPTSVSHPRFTHSSRHGNPVSGRAIANRPYSGMCRNRTALFTRHFPQRRELCPQLPTPATSTNTQRS
jgi:tetratricopeptide (TPR) repeat protein